MFSATLNEEVSGLVKLALKKPIKLSADPDRTTSVRLRQEVFKIEEKYFGDIQYREAMLLYLVREVFKDKVIVFFRTKK